MMQADRTTRDMALKGAISTPQEASPMTGWEK